MATARATGGCSSYAAVSAIDGKNKTEHVYHLTQCSNLGHDYQNPAHGRGDRLSFLRANTNDGVCWAARAQQDDDTQSHDHHKLQESPIPSQDTRARGGVQQQNNLGADAASRFSNDGPNSERRPVVYGDIAVHPRTGPKKHRQAPFFAPSNWGCPRNTPWFPNGDRRIGSVETGETAVNRPPTANVHRLSPFTEVYLQGRRYTNKRKRVCSHEQQQPAQHSRHQQQRQQHFELNEAAIDDLVERISKRIIRRIEAKLSAVLGEVPCGTRQHA